MEELKNNQPFHNHKHVTHLATLCVSRFTRSGFNKPYYCSQDAQYLEACDRKIMKMSNAVTDPFTGAQMEYGDLIKDLKPQETWTT